MRAKGPLIIIAVVGVLAALLAVQHFRATPSTSAAEFARASQSVEPSRAPLQYDLTTPVTNPMANNFDSRAQTPITVRCGDTLVNVMPAVPGQSVSVDCGQLYNQETVAQPVAYRAHRRGTTRYYAANGREQPRAQKRRSWKKEALIIGGSAGAGTAIGAVAGGKKGAAIGALSGGVAGLAYDLATRDKKKQ